jgi:hypothetical protein
MGLVPLPVLNPVLVEGQNRLTEPWRKFFQVIAAPAIPYYKFSSAIYTASRILTAADLGKIVKVDNGAANVTMTLPQVADADIDSWIFIMRLGTGNLTIKVPSPDTIEKSSAGGRIVCSESGRVLANLMLYLATQTKWAILGGTGIWTVY